MAKSTSETDRFKVGDIVRLKSGGPAMTVQEDLPGGDFRCQWFGGRKLESGIFPHKSLVAAPDDKDEA
jgi:uncharacterized protein YodC (DUF2158 family)